MPVDYIAASAIGLLVGIGELVSRYRDAPVKALGTPAAGLYIAINAAAAAAALFGLAMFWSDGSSPEVGRRVLRVLAAGFGAMAVFRSSLFVTRIGDQDVPIGPSAFLQVILGATDRGVDRLRAEARANAVSAAMSGVDYSLAHVALPTFCLALMQNLPPDDQAALAKQVSELSQSAMSPELKSLTLGLALMNTVGHGVLSAAVQTLSSQIRAAAVIAVTGIESGEMQAGSTVQLKVNVKDHSGRAIPGKSVTWTSSHPAVAGIDALGIVRAIAPGQTEVQASADGVSATAGIVVK